VQVSTKYAHWVVSIWKGEVINTQIHTNNKNPWRNKEWVIFPWGSIFYYSILTPGSLFYADQYSIWPRDCWAMPPLVSLLTTPLISNQVTSVLHIWKNNMQNNIGKRFLCLFLLSMWQCHFITMSCGWFHKAFYNYAVTYLASCVCVNIYGNISWNHISRGQVMGDRKRLSKSVRAINHSLGLDGWFVWSMGARAITFLKNEALLHILIYHKKQSKQSWIKSMHT